MGDHFFLWIVWSDFFLDRWRRSGVIRIFSAAVRALTALKSDNLLARICHFSNRDVVVGARDGTVR